MTTQAVIPIQYVIKRKPPGSAFKYEIIFLDPDTGRRIGVGEPAMTLWGAKWAARKWCRKYRDYVREGYHKDPYVYEQVDLG